MRWLYALPLVALVGFAGLGVIQLFDGHKPTFERISRDAPDTVFQPLYGDEEIVFSQLAGADPIIVNLWASWCTPCLAEHPLLMDLSAAYPGRVHGLLFEDTPENGLAFLERHGNPFTSVAMDPDGQGGLEFGLTGVPETFIISPAGEIIFHLRGQMTPEDLPDLQAAMSAPTS